MRAALIFIAVLIATPSWPAEDYRVMKLEQDVRTLERLVQTLQRQVSNLQQSTGRAEFVPPDTASVPQDSDQTWLKADAWNGIRKGMSELEVIEILGKPTALRPDASGRRVMLYTLEIGTTNFLTGSVSFQDGRTVEISKPALK